MGIKCEIGLRRKTYNVLTGSVLAVWNKVEDTLARDGSARGSAAKMQVRNLDLNPRPVTVSRFDSFNKFQTF